LSYLLCVKFATYLGRARLDIVLSLQIIIIFIIIDTVGIFFAGAG
jgi:hypothetical protein